MDAFGVQGSFESLSFIHEHLFSEVCGFAGKLRDGNSRLEQGGRSLKISNIFVVRPHANDLHSAIELMVITFEDFGNHLVNESMLQVDASGVKTGKVSDKGFVCGRTLERIASNDFDKLFGFFVEASSL